MLGWDDMWRSAGFILDKSPSIWIFCTTFPLTAFSVVHLQPLDRCTRMHYHMKTPHLAKLKTVGCLIMKRLRPPEAPWEDLIGKLTSWEGSPFLRLAEI